MGLMEWSSVLGNLGEFVGSVLVFVTLIFLIVQVRETRRGINASNFINATHMFNPVNIAIFSDGELFELWMRGCNEPESLTEFEAARFHLTLRAYMNNFISLYRVYRDGTFPEGAWKDFERNFAEVLATPGGESLIESVKFMNPDFAELMEVWREAAGGTMNWTNLGYQLVEERGAPTA